MPLYVTADTHFGHANLLGGRMARPRPFASIEAHDEYLVARWNDRVRPDDEVWHLGDFAYGASAAHCRAVFARLAGRKRLVWGNHDAKRVRELPWESQHERVEITAAGRTFVLSHYAQRTWNKARYGALHLYGHSHGSLPGCGRSLDVGVDSWDWRPVAIPEVLERMAEEARRATSPAAAAALAEAA